MAQMKVLYLSSKGSNVYGENIHTVYVELEKSTALKQLAETVWSVSHIKEPTIYILVADWSKHTYKAMLTFVQLAYNHKGNCSEKEFYKFIDRSINTKVFSDCLSTENQS